jgi:hypothetical protein
MPALKIPNKVRSIVAPFIERRVPGPEDFVVLSEPLLNATVKLARLLRDCKSKWAVSGDVGELLSGVSVPADHLSILTTVEGCEEISNKLVENVVQTPGMVERKWDREAKIDLRPYPVQVKSYEARFQIEGQRLDVYGGLQIRVGDWEWGDPLDYEPDYVYVGSEKVPVVPLRLKTELYIGLGWMDRVTRINEAMVRRHHGPGLGG